MYEDTNIFDFMYEQYKIHKPIRLIELFAGIGSQAMALKKLNSNFEHWRVVEFDKYAIASYNAIHDTNFPTLDITQIHASDLGIVDTDTYDYIMTYSFPCQSLSLAGKREGFNKGENTRSGLLWEVERLLDECENLPQILLMENVPQVHSTGENMDNFQLWLNKLESLGYSNYWQDLNAKDYGVPQTRNRCFCVSILGGYNYKFPKPIKLEKRLKDLLEDEVDEKYYLSEKMMNYVQSQSKNEDGFDRNEIFKRNLERLKEDGIACTLTTKEGTRATDIFVDEEYEMKDRSYLRNFGSKGKLQDDVCDTLTSSMGSGGGNVPLATIPNEPKLLGGLGEKLSNNGTQYYLQDRIYDSNEIAMCQATTANPYYQTNNLRIRKLTPLECWRLMAFPDEAFYKAQKVNSNAQLYKQAGNSIVVDVLVAIFRELIND